MRTISLAPSCTEVLFALERGEWLVGRTAFCDYPEEARRVPTVGGWTTANVDTVAELKPDLVLTSIILQERVVAALLERGLPVCHTDPRTLEDVLTTFETIASALGVPDRGRELRSRVENGIESLHPTHSLHPIKVYAEEWPDPPMASGNWVPDLILRADGAPFLRPGERSRTVSHGEVHAFDPDVILLNYCGMASVPADQQRVKFLTRSGWGKLRAARAGRVVVLDDSLLNRPGPRLVEGFQHIQRTLATVHLRV